MQRWQEQDASALKNGKLRPLPARPALIRAIPSKPASAGLEKVG
jgi:hypothetical protein